MPRLQIVRLPNDHTNGARAGHWTPQAMVADNDLALGRLIEVPEPKINTFMGACLLSPGIWLRGNPKGYLSKAGVGSQTGLHPCGLRSPILRRGTLGSERVVETRIKPYFEEQAELVRREAQTRVFRRNQAIGLVLVAVAILVFWLFRTNPNWIFPPGWWRP